MGLPGPPGGLPSAWWAPLPTGSWGDVWSTSPQEDQVAQPCAPSHTFPPHPRPRPSGSQRQPHPLPPYKYSSCTCCRHRPCLPEGHPYPPFQTEVSGHFPPPPAPSAHRLFCGPRSSSAGPPPLKAPGSLGPRRVLGPGWVGAAGEAPWLKEQTEALAALPGLLASAAGEF